MSAKSKCTDCENFFKVSTLKKYNGKCGRCVNKELPTVRINKRSKSTPDGYSAQKEVWEKNIGDRFWGNCFICNIRVHAMEWSCGYVKAGEIMKVICNDCNNEMGNEKLLEYKAKKYPSLEMVSKEVLKETPKETPKQVIKEVPKETPKQVIKEAPKETPKQVIKEGPKEVTKSFWKCFC